jgi:hypothetical protein
MYLVAPTYRLGEKVPTTPQSIGASAACSDELRRAGYTSFRRADAPAWTMAARAARPVVDRLAAVGLGPARFLYATERTLDGGSSPMLARFLREVGQGSASCLMVGGYSCANLVAGLDVAAMMCGRGSAPVVLVTTGALAAGDSRAYADGLAVISDGAAACALARHPVGPSFRVLSTALRSSTSVDVAGTALTDLRASGRQIRAVADEALAAAALARADVRYVVVGNLRASSQQFIAMAAGFRPPTVVVSAETEIGHCHSADPLIALTRLLDRPELRDGDHVLVVATGGRSWTAAALRHVVQEATPGA